jgi:hypothetical protein
MMFDRSVDPLVVVELVVREEKLRPPPPPPPPLLSLLLLLPLLSLPLSVGVLVAGGVTEGVIVAVAVAGVPVAVGVPGVPSVTIVPVGVGVEDSAGVAVGVPDVAVTVGVGVPGVPSVTRVLVGVLVDVGVFPGGNVAGGNVGGGPERASTSADPSTRSRGVVYMPATMAPLAAIEPLTKPRRPCPRCLLIPAMSEDPLMPYEIRTCVHNTPGSIFTRPADDQNPTVIIDQ